MKKASHKIFLLLTALVLLLGLSVSAGAAEALPEVGSTMHGFTVVEREMQQLLGAEGVLFEHDKSGAQVLYIALDDTNRSFDISFRTAALDETGLPHVFEHITISGSDKYPSPNLFFPIYSTTYNTFVNAMTMNSLTTYPLASLSEEQLLALADYYLDGLFHPLLYHDERLYRREAWRYELTDPNEPLTLTGTVYNEMRGNETMDFQWMFHLYEALYPGSYYSNNYGGNPDYIPDMTYESLLDFHQAYYHPGNSLTVITGDMQYSAFLALLDSYFSGYERAEIPLPDGSIAPLTALNDVTFPFPVEQSSNTENASIISYSFALNDADSEEVAAMLFLSSLLNHEASPLSQALRRAYPQALFASGVGIELPDPYFYIQGVNESDKAAIRNTIDRALTQMAQGVDTELTAAVAASERFSTYLLAEQANLGLNMSLSIAQNWANSGDLYFYNTLLDVMEIIDTPGFFENLIRTNLLDNRHRALAATVPVAGLYEEKQAALAEKLAAVKDAMSDQEIAELIQFTADLAAWSAEEAPRELLNQLQVVSVRTLPEEVKQYDIQDSMLENGVRLLTAEVATNEIGYTAFSLDTSGITLEDLHYLNLYGHLLGGLPTEKYELAELNTLLSQYLYNFWSSAGMFDLADGAYQPVLQTSWMNLAGTAAESMELVNQVLFHTELTDAETIQGIVNRLLNSSRSMLNSIPYNTLLVRSFALGSPGYAYYNYISDLDFSNFLAEASVMLEEDPQAFLARLQGVQDQLSNTYNATLLFAGNEASQAAFTRNLDTLFQGLERTPTTPADYSAIPLPGRNEAIVIDSSVQYNLIHASLAELGITNSAKLEALNLFIYESYLTPQIRHGIGAYDNLVSFSEQGLAMISYRDPGVAATYEVYEGLGEFLASVSVTQSDLDGYILRAYANYALPQSELNGAISALAEAMIGRDAAAERLRAMRELKSFSVSDIRSMAAVFTRLAEIGNRSTAGGASVIEANSERFDSIIYPDGGVTSTLTRGELLSLLFGGADNAIELAVAAGILQGSESGYRENDPATREELAIFLFRALELEATGGTGEAIRDLADVNAWAREAVITLVDLGLLSLDSEGHFLPTEGVTSGVVEEAVLQYMMLLAA